MISMARILLVIILALISACSKQGGQTNTKLEITSSFLLSGQLGGTMLYLINKDAETQKAIGIGSNQTQVTLTNGNWDFVVLSWSGENTLEGTLRCAKTSANLVGGEANVSLSLSTAACDDDFLSHKDFRYTKSTNALQLHSCRSIATATANGTCDGIQRGEGKSYVIKILSHKEASAEDEYDDSFLGTTHLSSECVPASSLSNGMTALPYLIPFGSASFRPAVKIEAYTTVGCSGSKQDFYFPHGLGSALTPPTESKVFNFNDKGNIYLSHGKIQIQPPGNFGNTVVGNSSPATIQILNYSQYPGFLSSVTIAGSDFTFIGGSFPGTDGTCSNVQMLNPGQSCTVRVQFSPSVSGARSATLSVNFNNGSVQTDTVPLNGSGQGVISASATPGAVNLSWAAISGASYNIYRSTTSGSFASPLVTGWASISYVDSTVTNGTQYFYQLRPVVGGTELTALPEVTAVPMSAPSGLGFNILGNNQISVYWTGVTGANHYDLLYGTSPGIYSNTISNVSSPRTVTGLSDNTTYYFKVRAHNVGTGTFVDSSEASQISAPASPTGLGITSSSGIHTITWTPVSGVQGYYVYRSTTSNSYAGATYSYVPGTGAASWMDNAATVGATYYYTVRAFNGVMSAYISEVSARSIGFVAPPTLSNFTTSSMDVSWSSASGSDSDILCVSYGPNSCTFQFALTSSPYNVTGLNPNTSYYFRILASNIVGTGASEWSSDVIQHTAPTAPTSLTLSSTSVGQVNLSWPSVYAVSSYSVYRGTASGTYSLIASNINTNSYIDTSVTTGTTYYYVVRSFNGLYSTDSSESVIRPVGATTVSPGTVSFTTIPFFWTSVTGADAYQIHYGTTPATLTSSSAVITTTTTTLTGLSPGTTYYYKLRSFNSTGSGASTESPMASMSTQMPAQLSLSTGSNIQFNQTLVGTTVQIPVTITNQGQTQATNISMGMSGSNTSLFAISANTCGINLNPTASCSFILSFSPIIHGSLSSGFSLNYHNGIGTITPIFDVHGNNSIASGTMGAYYSNASNWNTYASSNTLYGSSSAAVCAPSTDTECQHGGELRQTTLPAGFSSCTGLVGSDSLQAFNWECVVESGSVVFRSKGLMKNKGLKDLVNSTTWKTNQFFAKMGTVTVYQTPPAAWWTNSIYNIDALNGYQVGNTTTTSFSAIGIDRYPASGALQTFKLINTNAVYTFTSNLSLAGLHLSASGISLVGLPTTGSLPVLSTSNTATSTCHSTTGDVASADTTALICAGAGGANHSWIEVSATGISTTGGVGIFMVGAAFSRIHQAEVSAGNIGVRIKGSTKPNKFLYSKVFNTTSAGLKIEADKLSVFESHFAGNNIGVHFNGANGGTLGGSKVINSSGPGVKVENSSFTRIHNSIIAFGQAQGVLYGSNTGTGHKFHDNLLSSNCLLATNSNQGALEIEQTTNSFFYSFQTMHNNCHGLKVTAAASTDHRNTFRNATIVSNYKGIDLSYSNRNTFINIIASNNSGLSTSPNWTLNYSNLNNFLNVTATNSDYGLSFNNSSNNEFYNSLLLGGIYPCSFNNSTISFPPNSAGTSCTTSNIDVSNVDLSSSFVGKATSDTKNIHGANLSSSLLYSAVTDFINFMNPYRFWGKNDATSSYPFTLGNNSPCATGSYCAIWDWRLKALDDEVLDKTKNGNNDNDAFVAGATCSDILEGNDYVSDLMTTSNKFLLHAIEINFDGTGNDNGLCESNEACVYSPNFGYYQGEGNLTGSCNFTGGVNTGDLTGIILKAFTTNGI
jgi:hypothetical protein